MTECKNCGHACHCDETECEECVNDVCTVCDCRDIPETFFRRN